MAGCTLKDRKFKSVSLRFLLPAVFAVVLLLFFFFYDQSVRDFRENGVTADIILCLTVSLSGALGVVLYYNQLLNTHTLIALMFVCGFALRLCYAVRYGYSVNQHDVESLQSSGHLSYIYTIAETGALPASNSWQFSHPPLHHFLAACAVKLSLACGFTLERGFENIQLLTVFYSSMTMLAGYSMCRLCKIRGTNLCFCALLLAFHPIFSILAGSINNDILMIMLSMYAVVFLMKWYRLPKVKYAIICGAFCGLAMMTKVSAALIAVVAAISVVIKFITSKKLTFGAVALQALCFLAVFLPLGLWHPVRNYILFEQPLGYVAPIPVTSKLYTGDISIIKRLVLPFSTEKFGVYTDVWNEYNVWYYMLRNSLFGEYSFGSEGVAVFAVLANFVLIIASLVAFVYLIVKGFAQSQCLIPVSVLYFVQLAFFVYFNVKYPFGCTMDFRYIVPLLFCGIVFLGASGEVLSNSKSKFAVITVNAVKFSAVVLAVVSIFLLA